MEYVMDLHTHTLASGHGYSTLAENIESAKKMGLKVLGYSEHATSMPGGPHPFYLENLKVVPRKYGNLALLCGIEANIMDTEGHIDVGESTILKSLDYVIASLHSPCIEPGTMEENTNALLGAMRNPYVKIIGHPDDGRYPLDYERLVSGAMDHGVILEVNNTSLHPKSVRQGARENILKMLETCKQYRCPIIMGTDSHICHQIGDFSRAVSLLELVDFPSELVMNRDVKNLSKIVINDEVAARVCADLSEE